MEKKSGNIYLLVKVSLPYLLQLNPLLLKAPCEFPADADLRPAAAPERKGESESSVSKKKKSDTHESSPGVATRMF